MRRLSPCRSHSPKSSPHIWHLHTSIWRPKKKKKKNLPRKEAPMSHFHPIALLLLHSSRPWSWYPLKAESRISILGLGSYYCCYAAVSNHPWYRNSFKIWSLRSQVSQVNTTMIPASSMKMVIRVQGLLR